MHLPFCKGVYGEVSKVLSAPFIIISGSGLALIVQIHRLKYGLKLLRRPLFGSVDALGDTSHSVYSAHSSQYTVSSVSPPDRVC